MRGECHNGGGVSAVVAVCVGTLSVVGALYGGGDRME